MVRRNAVLKRSRITRSAAERMEVQTQLAERMVLEAKAKIPISTSYIMYPFPVFSLQGIDTCESTKKIECYTPTHSRISDCSQVVCARAIIRTSRWCTTMVEQWAILGAWPGIIRESHQGQLPAFSRRFPRYATESRNAWEGPLLA